MEHDGVSMSGTAVLLDLLIDQSIQLHLISALIFATVPAAATLVVGAMMVTVRRILAITYDVIRTLLVPGLLYCTYAGARFSSMGPAASKNASVLRSAGQPAGCDGSREMLRSLSGRF
jgi:hypothetical protein